jgi:hypothetical protein
MFISNRKLVTIDRSGGHMVIATDLAAINIAAATNKFEIKGSVELLKIPTILFQFLAGLW